jgi:hypothetical protein
MASGAPAGTAHGPGTVLQLRRRVWFTREQPQPPGSAVLDNGLRSPMPVLVFGPPLWADLLAGILGALVGGGTALAAFRFRGRTSAEAD